MKVLEVDTWEAPANLLIAQRGSWRLVQRPKPRGYYPMHRVMGYDAVKIKHRGYITILQERRARRWEDWMTDDPLFYYAMQQYAEGAAAPRILIGGLGLGLVLRHLSERSDIEQVVVVERQSEVIDLVWEQLALDSRFVLARGDFFDSHVADVLAAEDFSTVITDFWVGSPLDEQVQRLFLRTFEHVNERWPSALQSYHGLEPWRRGLLPAYAAGHYQQMSIDAKLGLLRMLAMKGSDVSKELA